MFESVDGWIDAGTDAVICKLLALYLFSVTCFKTEIENTI